MVYILDEGAEFDAPIERIWKYLMSETEHDHKRLKVVDAVTQGENVAIQTIDLYPGENMPAIRSKIKMTMYPPFGFVMEYVDGPMTGTKAFQFYIPKGNKTGVTVVGDFTAKDLDEDSVRRTALQFLEIAFNEDNENLRKLVAVTA